MTITGIRKMKETASLDTGTVKLNVIYQVDFTGEYSAGELLVAGGTTVGGITLPSEREEHDVVSNIYALSINVDREESSSANDGVGIYSVTFQSPSFTEANIHPLDREPDVQWRGTDLVEVATVDFDGDYFKNSFGDLYDPLPERPVQGCAECLISFNTETNPAAWCTSYSNTVYSASLWGVPAQAILMGVIEAQKVVEKFQGEDVTFWRVSVPLRFTANEDGWYLKIIDNGWRYIDDDGHEAVSRDETGTANPTAILLDGSGQKNPQASDPVYFPSGGFKVYPDSTWSGLVSVLPNPFI